MRRFVKRGLGALAGRRAAGARILTYHRVGGESSDERDVAVAEFARHLDALPAHSVTHLDDAVRRLEGGDERPCVVLTFDDGFADVYEHAWPLLAERRLPFTLYLATSYVGAAMHWDGSTARAAGPALSWGQIAEMVESGLCTIGNHTHTHARPERVDARELDQCSEAIEARLGFRPRHFAYPWGIVGAATAVRERFATAATGAIGLNRPGDDLLLLRRIPVRRSDPIEFFRAKLTGGLGPERAYGAIVWVAKAAGLRA
jgi:peptidoglycan/xylan/chitin deacetylase (PgdA/CDA1 family)